MTESTGARSCPRCGAQADPDALFCPIDGTPLTGQTQSAAEPVPYLISPTRIIILNVLSLGLYTLYWLYKTWQQYRDHTGEQVYPIWHGLTVFVPVYGSFRAHAHLRTFGELAAAAGLALAFAPGLAFAAVLVGWLRLFVAEGSGLSYALLAISIIAQLWMMLHAQPRITAYWFHTYGGRVVSMGVGKGEIIVAIIGVLGWLGILGGGAATGVEDAAP
jgi:hypothetical protein